MLDNDEVSIFIKKIESSWRGFVLNNDPGYNIYRVSNNFLDWFSGVDDEMQNRFVDYVDSGGL